MTKAKSKPCICCKWYSGGIPCAKAHKPRMFVDGGLRRVCDDFAHQTVTPVKKHSSLYTAFLRIFGVTP